MHSGRVCYASNLLSAMSILQRPLQLDSEIVMLKIVWVTSLFRVYLFVIFYSKQARLHSQH